MLIPRAQIPEWVERDSKEVVSLEELDVLKGDGVFSWLHEAGDRRDLGVPPYVPYRIGLCRKIRRDGCGSRTDPAAGVCVCRWCHSNA